MQNPVSVVVVLGTGGTIAGAADDASDNVGYRAGSLGVERLVQALPALAHVPLECEQVAQLDSKDMRLEVWATLARRCEAQLARPEVAGVVVTHGTDTLEETAWLLQRVLAPRKPVVLAAAMRPATSAQADGPQNLLDAIAVARVPGARGVVAVLAGQVHGAREVRKRHPYRADAFDSGDAGRLGVVEEGVPTMFRDWPAGDALGSALLPAREADWPWVEIVSSHAGADGRAVRALVEAGVRGLVVACTGNGTLHEALEPALAEAATRGVVVRRATRCGDGRIVDGGASVWPSAADLTPVKARVDLLLELLRPREARA